VSETAVTSLLDGLQRRDPRAIGRAISIVEDNGPEADTILSSLDKDLVGKATVLGITGPPGAGKSTLTSQIIATCRARGERIGIIAIDPTSPLSGGAILGDRIRMMRHSLDRDVVVRSMATRGRLGGLCGAAGAAVRIMAGSGCQRIIIETVGVGQSEMDIIRLADITALVMAPGLGDDIQAMKAGLLEVADVLVVNKGDMNGAEALFMDMEAVARERKEKHGKAIAVCRTIARDGTGIEELLNEMANIEKQYRASGEHERRRNRSYDLEVLDWSLEMIRPHILQTIEKNTGKRWGDPKLQATKILQTMGLDYD
jgi:LAO/AO transport system kinase